MLLLSLLLLLLLLSSSFIFTRTPFLVVCYFLFFCLGFFCSIILHSSAGRLIDRLRSFFFRSRSCFTSFYNFSFSFFFFSFPSCFVIIIMNTILYVYGVLCVLPSMALFSRIRRTAGKKLQWESVYAIRLRNDRWYFFFNGFCEYNAM